MCVPPLCFISVFINFVSVYTVILSSRSIFSIGMIILLNFSIFSVMYATISPMKFVKSLHASLSLITTLFLIINEILSFLLIGKQCPGIYPAHFCLLGRSPFHSGPRRADVHRTSCAPNPLELRINRRDTLTLFINSLSLL